MKTTQKLVKRFHRLWPHHEAYLDELESYPGYYRVAITDLDHDLTAWYTFTSCRDFREWMNGVVLD